MIIRPETLNHDQRNAVTDWLKANGCRDYVALEPILIKGSMIEYQALCRRHRTHAMRLDPDGNAITTRRQLRIRHPLRRYLPR